MTNEKEMNRTVPVNDEIPADETLVHSVTRSPCLLPAPRTNFGAGSSLRIMRRFYAERYTFWHKRYFF